MVLTLFYGVLNKNSHLSFKGSVSFKWSKRVSVELKHMIVLLLVLHIVIREYSSNWLIVCLMFTSYIRTYFLNPISPSGLMLWILYFTVKDGNGSVPMPQKGQRRSPVLIETGHGNGDTSSKKRQSDQPYCVLEFGVWTLGQW